MSNPAAWKRQTPPAWRAARKVLWTETRGKRNGARAAHGNRRLQAVPALCATINHQRREVRLAEDQEQLRIPPKSGSPAACASVGMSLPGSSVLFTHVPP
ncbi:hypothetical protein AAFF_G00343470 [Aldrovandia affinis]|uniref:Uncharacterized protein n=1 Tax=Aldrovandia affinis TaxID=143900 RepID=A0AAD7SJX2_9TELE|nr:hypothetical protein AAFF_G00343470 [Aldrovandia affinis]